MARICHKARERTFGSLDRIERRTVTPITQQCSDQEDRKQQPKSKHLDRRKRISLIVSHIFSLHRIGATTYHTIRRCTQLFSIFAL